MHTLFVTLLAIHIACGTVSLISAAGALTATKGQYWHRKFGDFFFYGMTGVFVTAVPMTLLHPSLFLFLISFFSYYFAFTGRRYALNTAGLPKRIDWLVSGGMLIMAVGMLVLGIYLYPTNATRSITILVFGALGANFSFTNLKIYWRGGVRGRERLMQHFSSMLAATIAALTAFAVTNFTFHPEIVLWLGPTVVLVPVIFWWHKRV